MKKLKLFFLVTLILIGAFWIYLNQNYATPILMYHSLDKSRVDTYAAVDPEVFRKQMEFIKARDYRVVSLSEYCRLLKRGSPIPRSLVVITFDDGYKDNLRAVEILKEFDYPATIFIIVRNIGVEGYLSETDILSFLQDTKINIGSHTLTHAYLPSQEKTQIKMEVGQSKELLGEYFSQNIETIAYPTGGFNQDVLTEVAADKYLCACATNRGFSKELNRFALRRVKITNRDLGFKLWAKLSGFYNSFRKPKNPY